MVNSTTVEELLDLGDRYLLYYFFSFSICLLFFLIVKKSFKQGGGKLPDFGTQEASCS